MAVKATKRADDRPAAQQDGSGATHPRSEAAAPGVTLELAVWPVDVPMPPNGNLMKLQGDLSPRQWITLWRVFHAYNVGAMDERVKVATSGGGMKPFGESPFDVVRMMLDLIEKTAAVKA